MMHKKCYLKKKKSNPVQESLLNTKENDKKLRTKSEAKLQKDSSVARTIERLRLKETGE